MFWKLAVPATVKFLCTTKSLETVKSCPIVTSSGNATVIDLPPAPNAAEPPPVTVISLVVPNTSNVVLPSTALLALEP